MSHPIQQRISRVSRIARRLAITRSAAIVAACVLSAGLLLAAFDYVTQFEDVGTRLLFSGGWLATAIAATFYFFLPTWKSEWSETTVAQMIERRFPSLANRLNSSLAFLQTADEATGSKSLMRSVINQTATDLEGIDVRQAIDRRPTMRSLALAAIPVCLGITMFCVDTPNASKAVSRLLIPWSDNPWPRIHHLAFVDPPTKVARGGDLRLALVNEKGDLPQHVNLEIVFDDSQPDRGTDVIPMQRVSVRDADGQSREQMVFERTNISRSFRFRATGGDDDTMAWKRIEVVDAPQVAQGSVEISPPHYTGWQPRVIDEAMGGLRVLQGTQIRLRGTVDRPVESVALQVRKVGSANSGRRKSQPDSLSDEQFLASIHQDGLRYEVPASSQSWTIQQPSEYGVSITDRDGTQTVDAESWSVRVVRDERPQLKLLEPDNEELISPEAIVRLVVQAEDDLLLRRVELRFLQTDNSDDGEQRVSLFVGPEQPPTVAMPTQLPPAVNRRQVEHEWDLTGLRLSPGAVLSFYLYAEDYKGQSNQTLSRRLVVVSENDLIDRVGRRQSLVLSRMQQRLNQQRQARDGVEAVSDILRETNVAAKSTMDRLQSAVLSQRRVNSALAEADAEVVKELQRLRGILDRSQVGDVDVRERVEKTLSSLKELADVDLLPALRLATDAKQTLQAERDQQLQSSKNSDAANAAGGESLPPEALKYATQLLAYASDRQQSAITKLESLLDELSAWDNYRKFAQELSELLRQQRNIQQQTQEAADAALAESNPSSSSNKTRGNSRAALKTAAARQLDLARQADRAVQNLAKAEAKLQQNDPQSAQMIAGAIQRAQDGAVSGNMREAGRQIGQNQLGQASQQQQAAKQTLEEMVDELSRSTFSPDEKVERMEQAGRELQRLQRQQAELTEGFRKAKTEQDSSQKRRNLQRLRKRQEQVAKDVRKLQRQLQRLQAQQTSQQAGQAASSGEQAANDAGQGSAESAEQQSQLAEAQMEQTQQQLQQQMAEAKSQLAREQMIRLPQLVDALIAQQKSVVEETIRLNDVRMQTGELTPAQEASIQVTAEAQRIAAQDTALVAKQMGQLPAFQFALHEVEEAMLGLAGDLDQLNTSAATQEVGKKIIGELQLIREMLEEEKNSPQNQQQQKSGGQGGPNQQQDGQQGGIDPRLKQLKLLRGMQVSINGETKQLNSAIDDASAMNSRQRRRRALAKRQGQLAEIVGDLFKSAAVESDTRQLEEPTVETKESDDLNLDALDEQLELLLQ